MTLLNGRYETVELGPPPHTYAAVLPAGTWFGAETTGTDVLVSAMVAPGFAFEDFELGTRAQLLELFPEHEEIVKRMTDDR